MKSNLKKAIAIVAALALVIVVGKFMSDYSLKATDGEENIVEDDQATEDVSVDSESEDVVLESESVEIPEDVESTEDDSTESEEIENEGSESSEDEAESEDSEEESEVGDYDEGSVYITATTDSDEEAAEGTKITLTANVEGFENTSYTYQWQKSLDGENWEDISGANSSKYTFTLTEETEDYTWRVVLVTED